MISHFLLCSMLGRHISILLLLLLPLTKGKLIAHPSFSRIVSPMLLPLDSQSPVLIVTIAFNKQISIQPDLFYSEQAQFNQLFRSINHSTPLLSPLPHILSHSHFSNHNITNGYSTTKPISVPPSQSPIKYRILSGTHHESCTILHSHH